IARPIKPGLSEQADPPRKTGVDLPDAIVDESLMTPSRGGFSRSLWSIQLAFALLMLCDPARGQTVARFDASSATDFGSVAGALINEPIRGQPALEPSHAMARGDEPEGPRT